MTTFKKILKGTSIIFGLFVLLAIYANLSSKDSMGNPETAALVGADEIIKKQLKSPSSYSAKYSEILWRGKGKDNENAYIVAIAYEAANSFGAKILNCNLIAIRITKDSYAWSESRAISKDESRDSCDKSIELAKRKEKAEIHALFNDYK